MADGTRLRLLDDSIKNLGESSTAQNQQLDEQQLLSEVIVRLTAIEGCLEQTNRVSSSSLTVILVVLGMLWSLTAHRRRASKAKQGDRRLPPGPPGLPILVVDVSAKVGSLVEDMTYRMLIGSKDAGFHLKPVVDEALKLIGAINLADYIPCLGSLDLQGLGRRMKAVSKVLDQFLEKIIDEHIQVAKDSQNNHKDFIDMNSKRFIYWISDVIEYNCITNGFQVFIIADLSKMNANNELC
ncbi:hypothetical protein NE237_021573 [Protea cynaroides]|uniref:Uncharacterized protein n=1 Tax=Protea cynaroides TaxID=273540 RepID=A0A9Q0H8S9_9MAGN|nr:hypothetical protein NE237_021573 [Protea cynaroides]